MINKVKDKSKQRIGSTFARPSIQTMLNLKKYSALIHGEFKERGFLCIMITTTLAVIGGGIIVTLPMLILGKPVAYDEEFNEWR